METILQTRAKVKKGHYALIPDTGYVNHTIPGIEDCLITVLVSPKIGASFVAYRFTAKPGGKTTVPFGKETDIEVFLYVLKGNLYVYNEKAEGELSENGYLYAAPGRGLSFRNESEDDVEFLIYKKKYLPINGEKPWAVMSSVKEQFRRWNQEGLTCLELLPSDLVFDIAFNILIFYPDRKHGFIEIHDQEHGAYLLSGEGSYYLDETWYPVREKDFIWMAPYVSQGAYSCGNEKFSYLYSKDINRDVEL